MSRVLLSLKLGGEHYGKIEECLMGRLQQS